ncbi:Retrovirus-related Pol polyprotein from transposon TNT 1-94 [Vitis vinifera]|uniref:Retrovirus-related Pol polyprotein from transposon TNT 1-94 n=1 Tax=Vitis vinifera TaxID=29760 RepID=A0A438ILJ6_VITVI|nr:Retrovirus-related Pol polyprotein from transposon TNT 1-94 [Vitis vinifera]
MGSIKSEIERFIGKNDFNVWRMRMKAILFQQGVKDALKDESELPVTMTAKEKSDIDEKAYHLIILALGDKALREFSEETTAKGVWNKLEQLYMQNSLSNRLYLKERLYGFKMQEDRLIADNLDDFAKIVLEMSNIGIKVDDEDKAVLVLKSLPGLYSNFKETMKYGRKTLTLEEVQSALRSKELELKKKGSNGEGLSIRGRKKDILKEIVLKGSLSKMRHLRRHLRKKADKINGLFILHGEILNDSANVPVSTVSENTKLWHLRLGHISQRGLHEIVKQGLLGNDKIKDLEFCEHCIYGKASRVKFSHAIHRTKETLDYVHSDSWGPAPVISHGGNRVRCMLSNAQLPKEFWAEAVYTAAYSVNRCPSSAIGMWTSGSVNFLRMTEKFSLTKKMEKSRIRDGARRSIRPPQRFGYNDMVAYSLSIGEELSCAEPKNYLEAISCKDSPKWMTAMQEEFESLLKNGTWQLVDKPKGCKVVGCKWVFKKKLGIPHVEPERFKARLVAKAIHKEKEWISMKFSHLWAFLHGELEEEIFMQQPKGFIVKGKENQVCLLKRSLYGLKQSPRQWYKRFDKFMTSVGYSRNDMLLASKSITEIAHLKTQLQSEFEMKDLGCAKKILGIEPYRDSRYMSNPGRDHWEALKWILRYLKGTTDFGLIYQRKQTTIGLVEGYVDSDYAKDMDERRSITVEYVAAAEATKEALWLKGLVSELGMNQKSVTVFCDSQSALCLTKNQGFHERTKHIDVRFHFIRDIAEQGLVNVSKISTKDNPADMLTKPISKVKFKQCLNLINVGVV